MKEEEKVVAKMADGERKKVAEKALQLAELRAESIAAEEESLIDELAAETEPEAEADDVKLRLAAEAAGVRAEWMGGSH